MRHPRSLSERRHNRRTIIAWRRRIILTFFTLDPTILKRIALGSVVPSGTSTVAVNSATAISTIAPTKAKDQLRKTLERISPVGQLPSREKTRSCGELELLIEQDQSFSDR